jgi:glycosyltransferase involved in cell wall biosynthesis
MIRVLNIISDTNIGGAGRVLTNYLQYCDRGAFEPSVALPRGSLLKAPLEALGTAVYEVDGIADRSLDWRDIALLRALIRRVRPDIVHTHGAMSGRIAARQMGCKVVYTRHSAFPVSPVLKYPPGRWVNKWINEHYADQIIAISPACAKNLVDAGVSPARITTMMNGVKPVARKTQEECAALRQKLALPPNTFVFGIMARLEEYKGHMDLLNAVKLLEEQGKRPIVLIAGAGSYEQTLKQRCTQLGLDDRVRFLGFVNDVADILSLMDVQLNASYGTEASSIALLEGLSMGVPVLASRYGGNPWQVDDGEDGLLFNTRDPEDMARKMARLMDEPDTLARMGQRAKEIFQQRFTGQIMAEHIEAVYRAALKGAGNGNETE